VEEAVVTIDGTINLNDVFLNFIECLRAAQIAIRKGVLFFIDEN
jgi:hypothetical protein